MNLRCLAWSSAAFAILCLTGCKPTEAKPSTTYSLSSAYSSYGTFRILTQQELSQIWDDAGEINPSGAGSRLAYMLTKETPEGPEFRTFDVWGTRSPLIAQRSRDLVAKANLTELNNLAQLRWHSISMAPYSLDARAGAGADQREFLDGLMPELESAPQQLASYKEDSIFFLVTFVGYEGFNQLPFLVSRTEIPKLPRYLRTVVTKAIEHSTRYESLRRAEGARVAKSKGEKAKEVIKNLMVTVKDLPKE